MSYHTRHRWFRRTALGLAAASAICAGSVAAATSDGDPYRTDIYVRAGESQGGPDGGAVASTVLRSDRAAADDQQFRSAHAFEAQAQGGLSGYVIGVADGLVADGDLSAYLKSQQVWMEGVSDLPTAVPAEG